MGPLPVTGGWLTRIETLGTTIVVLMVGSMVLWYEAVERERGLVVTIGSGMLLYVAVLVLCGRRSATGAYPGGPSRRRAWWPARWPS